ncbi:phosphatidylserine lipase ABHD16A-like isoform X2 [Clytia hemisphaerica]|uniref:Uncharacterized protein n=1 Tax=Clytia hemisphaerica TaxID=252671 RepID=A0A7M5U0K5_9CNID|eukprot:TCONS_00072149-protein
MLQYIFGPRLYRIFSLVESTGQRKLVKNYEVNRLEWLSESFLHTVSYALSITYYCSPFFVYYGYTREIFSSPDRLIYYLKFSLSICIGMTASYLLRGLGRSINTEYQKFIEVLNTAKKDKLQMESLRNYDFDFKAWPVNFRWDESSIKSEVTNPSPISDHEDSKSVIGKIFSIPSKILDYCLGHGIARPMAFPGSVKLLQMAMAQLADQGRTSLLEKKGLRAKLLCENGNEIDSMFVDRRSDETGEGQTLVVTCEGNAAFYEVGIMDTARKAGYSVLGWNHPGFFGSTGKPFPDQEREAIDVVMKYAVTKLGFEVDNIILFAWSIGGYTASYGAMMYPDVKAVVLDATFDGIIQLGAARMPSFAVNTVKRVIRKYMFLDVTRQIVKYSGPVQLIRRQREEIITTRPQVPITNRGNYLLWKMLLYRYPNIISEKSTEALWQYLAAYDSTGQESVIAKNGGIDEEACERRLTLKKKPIFPLEKLGESWSEEERIEVTLFLATKYMAHFDATHCIALPASYFQMPWAHRVESFIV